MGETASSDDQKGQYQLIGQPLTIWSSAQQTAVQYLIHLNYRRLARVLAAILLIILGLGIYDHTASRSPISSLISSSSTPSKHAFATLLAPNSREGADQDDIAADDYFLATRVLNYQIKHSLDTKYHDANAPFLVLCPDGVAEEKKAMLTAEGATIVHVDRITTSWFEIANKAWGEVMAKLFLFTYLEYERILFIDADVYLIKSLDGIFEDAAVADMPVIANKTHAELGEDVLPPTYSIAGITDGASGIRKKPANYQYLNSGFFIVRPDLEIFEHLMKWLHRPKSFNPALPEQNLMNDVFRPDGPMPWQHMDPKWDTSCPEPTNIEEGWKTIHSKLWKVHASPCDIDPVAGRMWYRTLGHMEAFYANRAL